MQLSFLFCSTTPVILIVKMKHLFDPLMKRLWGKHSFVHEPFTILLYSGLIELSGLLHICLEHVSVLIGPIGEHL